MKNFLVISFFLVCLSLEAKKYYAAKIFFNDGSVKSGYATIVSNLKKTFRFKMEMESNSSKIMHDNVFKIIYTPVNGKEYVFERLGKVQITMNYHKKYDKRCKKSQKKKIWLLNTSSSDKISVYIRAHNYRINKKGDIFGYNNHNVSVLSQFNPTEIEVFLKRPNEACASRILTEISGPAIKIAYELIFRKMVSSYFRDSKELVERIRKKEFKFKDLDKLIKAYESY